MSNFLATAPTKMVTIQDVKNVIMLWKKNGEEIIKTKNEKLELDIVKITGIKLGNKIRVVMMKTLQKSVNIKKIIIKKTLKLENVISNIVDQFVKVNSLGDLHVKSVVKQVKDLMDTIVIIPNLLMSYGFVKVVISAYIKRSYRERLSEKTPKGEATVRTIEETGREKPEAVFPPSNLLGQYVNKITESNSKQCINNDLWIQNLRSTGLLGV